MASSCWILHCKDRVRPLLKAMRASMFTLLMLILCCSGSALRSIAISSHSLHTSGGSLWLQAYICSTTQTWRKSHDIQMDMVITLTSFVTKAFPVVTRHKTSCPHLHLISISISIHNHNVLRGSRVSICLSIYLSIYLSICLYTLHVLMHAGWLSVYCVYSVCISVYIYICM